MRSLVEPKGAKMIHPCDVQNDEDIIRTFDMVKATYGRLDFLIHSIAFAPPQELRNPNVSDEPRRLAPGDGHQRFQPGGGLSGLRCP